MLAFFISTRLHKLDSQGLAKRLRSLFNKLKFRRVAKIEEAIHLRRVYIEHSRHFERSPKRIDSIRKRKCCVR